MEVDPYVYPGTDVLINKFDIRDPRKLEELEIAFHIIKAQEPLPEGDLDYSHLKAIHRHFLGDIYPWAGEERTVDIIKGHSHFARKEFIEKELTKLFTKLNQTDSHLKNLEPTAFTEKAAYYFNEINAAHPFREGNGRTLRAFFDLLAEQAGYQLNWSIADKQSYIQANILGFNGDYVPMQQVFQQILVSKQLAQTLQEQPSLSKETQILLIDYLDKKIALHDCVQSKVVHLAKDTDKAKQYAVKAHQIEAELKHIAHQLVERPDFTVQHVSYAQSLASQANVAVIKQQFERGQFNSADIAYLQRDIKRQAETQLRALSQNKGRTR